jgi:hypothetical protein
VVLLELLRKPPGLPISLSGSEVASANSLSQSQSLSLSRWYYILVVVKGKKELAYLRIN